MYDFGKKKNEIKFKMEIIKDIEGAKRELNKIKMTIYDRLDTIDKFFIDYNLALYSAEDGNLDLANIYLENINNIFRNDKVKEAFGVEYCDYLWLKTNENRNDMTDDEIKENIMYIYEYYKSLEMYAKAISSKINISIYKRDKEKILEELEELLICDDEEDKETFIKDILQSCDSICHSLYIEALDLVERHNIVKNII